jgi:hypothetical protein
MLSDGFMTRTELARVLGISSQTITYRELRGHLPQPENCLGRPVYGPESQQIVKEFFAKQRWVPGGLDGE